MWKIIQILLIIFTIETSATVNFNIPKFEIPGCDCPNPYYVDKPTDISNCYPKIHFELQIKQNFNKVSSQVNYIGFKRKCNFTEYKADVEKMRENTFQIMEAFYNCSELNCTDSINKAIVNYNTFRTTFSQHRRCDVAKFSEDCALGVFEIRAFTFASAENVITSVLECVKMKAQQSCANPTLNDLVTLFLAKKLKVRQTMCNCVDIAAQPFPKNEAECFSEKFIAKLRNFVKQNYKNIDRAYSSIKTPFCDYKGFKRFYAALSNATNHIIDSLEEDQPTFAELNNDIQSFRNVALSYGSYLRDYILTNGKSCYYTPRRAINNPNTTADWLIGILYKCVGYRDSSNSVC